MPINKPISIMECQPRVLLPLLNSCQALPTETLHHWIRGGAKANSLPLKIGLPTPQKETLVFQPSNPFSGINSLLVSGPVTTWCLVILVAAFLSYIRWPFAAHNRTIDSLFLRENALYWTCPTHKRLPLKRKKKYMPHFLLKVLFLSIS